MPSESVEKLMDERRRTEAYPIFVGAIAVSQSETLVTDTYPFIVAMKNVKANIEEVPYRFRARVENFDIKFGYILDVSDEADATFRLLLCYADKVSWVYDWGSLGPGRGNGYRGNRYALEDDDAEAYIAKAAFTEEELDWLWQFAQALHVFPAEPVVRRVTG
jgi:hypothetical protein